MKRYLFCVLALLALLLAGCGSGEDVSGTVTPPEAEVTDNTKAPEDAEQPTADPGEGEETPLTLGEYEGGVYTNRYLGLGCTLDSDWVFYSAEELQEIPGDVASAMDGTDLGSLMEDYQQLMDMRADNAQDLAMINVLYTKLPLQERLAYLAMSEEELIDSVLAQSELMIEAYTQSGITVNEFKKVSVTFLGEQHWATWMDAAVEEIPYYVLQIYDYTAGQYGATITLGSYVEDNTGALLELFYEVE